MMYVEDLNRKFAFSEGESSLFFTMGKGEIPVVEIKNAQSSAVISLQGAQILSWKPIDGDEVIWLSDDAVYAPGKPVRGGIPVCWPWFGTHEKDPFYPAHGFARNVMWEVLDARSVSDNETEVRFQLRTDELEERYNTIWSQPTVVEYRVSISQRLSMELSTFNKSDQSISISQALHTYFNVNDIDKTVVYGLEGKRYLDKTEAYKLKVQEGPVTIESEVDRIYLDTDDDISIDDRARKIIIKQKGSRSSIVWNPWKDLAKKMEDLEDEGYRKMICVETANVADDVVHIKPNERYFLQVSYNLQKKL